MSVKVAEGHQAIMPYFIVERADKFIDFLQVVFDAKVKYRMDTNDGAVMHAELILGDGVVMISEATATYGRNNSGLFIYVADTQQVYDRALEHGATSLMEPRKADYADLTAGFLDPFGNTWWPATLA